MTESKVSVRVATRADMVKFTHYRSDGCGPETWCGERVVVTLYADPILDAVTDLNLVTCPWCQDVIRKVVKDWKE